MPWQPLSQILIGRSSPGMPGSAAASGSGPKSGGLSRNSARSLMLPGPVLLMWTIVPSGEAVTSVLACAFLPGYAALFQSGSLDLPTGVCVTSVLVATPADSRPLPASGAVPAGIPGISLPPAGAPVVVGAGGSSVAATGAAVPDRAPGWMSPSDAWFAGIPGSGALAFVGSCRGVREDLHMIAPATA